MILIVSRRLYREVNGLFRCVRSVIQAELIAYLILGQACSPLAFSFQSLNVCPTHLCLIAILLGFDM